jgi:hypothetical protein
VSSFGTNGYGGIFIGRVVGRERIPGVVHTWAEFYLDSICNAFSPDLHIKQIWCRKKHSFLTTAITLLSTEICQISSASAALEFL